MIVYAITNLINGKRYIGITEYTLKQRWNGHIKSARDGVKTALHRAMAKYGVENFAIVELARLVKGTSRETLCEMERLYIAQENTMTPHGYNMTPGGDGMPKGEKNPNLGKKMDDLFREKCRNGWTPERRAAASSRWSEMNKVKNQSDEHKSRLKEAWTRSPDRRATQASVMSVIAAADRMKPETNIRMREAGAKLHILRAEKRSLQ